MANYDMSSLPPNYVTLVQLRDIWMKKKEEEKKQKEKEEEERKQAEEKRKQEEEELRKQEAEKRKQEAELRKQEAAKRNDGRGYGRIVVRERVKKTAFIDEKGKGKGKEVIIGGYGNVEGNNKGHFRRPTSGGDERNRNEKMSNGVAINGVRGGIPDRERVAFRGGFRNNRGPYGRSRNDRLRGESDFGGGMLDDNEKRGERGRNNGGYLNRDYRLKESRDAVLKGNGEKGEVLGEGSGLRNGYKGKNGSYWRFRENRGAGNELEKVGEKKAEGEILEAFNEKCCLGEGDRNGSNVERVGVVSEVGGGILSEKKEGDRRGRGSFGKRRSGERHYRYDKRNNRFKGRRDAGLMGNKLELETEKRAAGDEILEVVNEKDGNDDKKRNGTNEEGSSDDRVAVERVKNGEKEGVGKGYRRYGNWKGKVKAKDEVFNENRCLSEEKRNGTNEDRVEGEGSSGDRVAVERKVDAGVLTVESKVRDGFLTVENSVDDGVLTVQSKVKNAEKDGVGYGRHMNKNRRDNFCEKRSGNNRFGNWRGDLSGMKWVKKEDKSAGTSGVQ